MTFEVRVLRRAKRDQIDIVRWIAQRSRAGAESWISAYEKMLNRLSEQADTFPLAMENDEFDEELREGLFKTRRGLIYRMVFTIVEAEVRILRVRGPGQDVIEPDDIDRPEP